MGRLGFTKPVQLTDDMMLAGFTSGEEVVDTWLTHFGPHARRRGTAVVYVSYESHADFSTTPPAGFYTLSSGAVTRAEVAGGWLKRNTPTHIPVILLGMLGVHTTYQGHGLGDMLLHDALTRALSIAETMGARALLVDPLRDDVKPFYLHRGFREAPGTPHLFAPLAFT